MQTPCDHQMEAEEKVSGKGEHHPFAAAFHLEERQAEEAVQGGLHAAE